MTEGTLARPFGKRNRPGTAAATALIAVFALVLGHVAMRQAIQPAEDAVRKFPGILDALSFSSASVPKAGSHVRLNGRSVAVLYRRERVRVDWPNQDSVVVYLGRWNDTAAAQLFAEDYDRAGVLTVSRSGQHVIDLIPANRFRGDRPQVVLRIEQLERPIAVFFGAPE